MSSQIVITGIGLASSLGLDADQTWRGLLERRGSARPMAALESSPPTDAGGYQAVDLPDEYAADLPREVRYLRWTIEQALQSAAAGQFVIDSPRRCGVVLGTTLHGMRAGGAFLRSGDPTLLRDFTAGAVLQRAMESIGFAGDAITSCSACSSSLASIGLAMTLLRTGELDLVIAGGYDTVSEYAWAGFHSLRLVAADALRPFAKDRKGMKLGEGYGIVVLERGDHASRRGATALAEVAGWGESSDAHHLTQPHPRGEGAAAAMRSALASAQLAPAAIGLIAAHATGTPDNDAGEYSAYAAVFGDALPSVPVVAIKSHLGHTLGGAGAVELILSLTALREQRVPPTLNTQPHDLEFPQLALVSGEAQPAAINATLNTSLGFGGANACVVLTRPRGSGPPLAPMRDVFVSGVGVVLPEAIGNDAFVQRLASRPDQPAAADSGNLPEADYLHLLNARRIRRMSDYVKLTLAAATLAFRDAGVLEDVEFARSCSAMLGSTHAASGYCVSYYDQIVREGMAAANPMLFAEGVPNSGSAHLGLMLGIKGSCQTIIGTRTSGLDALRLAFLRVASGHWERAVVSAAEEFTPVVNSAYAHCGLHSTSRSGGAFASEQGFAIGAGAVTLLLESAASLAARGGQPRGKVLSCAGGRLRGRDSVDDVAQVIDQIGRPQSIVASANATWIDRLEAAAIGRSAPGASVSSLYGHFAETFSAGPLAALAAILLTRKLPSLVGAAELPARFGAARRVMRR